MSYHKCTDEDFAQFYPIRQEYKTRYDQIREDENRGFYCIDWDKEDISLGISKTGYVNYLDIMLVPCNFIGKASPGITKDDIHENCHADLEA